ncbi:MAG: hypothetical protein U0U67_10260 [Chitinophagales bacterium]
MKNIVLLLFVFLLFSCKKDINLSETHWTLYYQYNSTFNFYAESDLYFKQNYDLENYRNFDTVSGTWYVNKKNVNFYFVNDDRYEGKIINADSMTGTLLLPHGDHGVWHAKRK